MTVSKTKKYGENAALKDSSKDDEFKNDYELSLSSADMASETKHPLTNESGVVSVHDKKRSSSNSENNPKKKKSKQDIKSADVEKTVEDFLFSGSVVESSTPW